MSDATKDGGPAFPVTIVTRYGDEYQLPGMSLRDWFAGQALVAIINSEGPQYFSRAKQHAETAFSFADAMLAERGERP